MERTSAHAGANTIAIGGGNRYFIVVIRGSQRDPPITAIKYRFAPGDCDRIGAGTHAFASPFSKEVMQ